MNNCDQLHTVDRWLRDSTPAGARLRWSNKGIIYIDFWASYTKWGSPGKEVVGLWKWLITLIQSLAHLPPSAYREIAIVRQTDRQTNNLFVPWDGMVYIWSTGQ